MGSDTDGNFKNGKKVLEKPAEILLDNKDIDMPFCFCWANDPWARSWSKIPNTNAWADKYETQSEKEILLMQDYGNEVDWERHFQYLLPFFQDERYIKVDGKPLFIFYRPEAILVLEEMIKYFNTRIQEYGMLGICFWGANSQKVINGLDAILYIHASSYLNGEVTGMYLQETRINNIKTYDYQDVWNNIIATPKLNDSKIYFGGIVDQDDTPRRGKLGFCLTGVTPEIFKENFYKLVLKNMYFNNEFVFIDAWNEWGEGNYLEPDTKNEYAFLEAVKCVMDFCNGDDIHIVDEWKKIEKSLSCPTQTGLVKETRKYKQFYSILDKWLKLEEHNCSVGKYMRQLNYHSIIIYGYMSLGSHVLVAAQKEGIVVKAIIDKREGLKCEIAPVIQPDSDFPEANVIIVTPVVEFDEIKSTLVKKTSIPIVSIEEIIDGCFTTRY